VEATIAIALLEGDLDKSDLEPLTTFTNWI
jgi:hypothetical protein